MKVVTEQPESLEAEVDADIAKFNEWFQRHLQNDKPLAPSEKAVLKTYLWWKVKGENDGAQSSG